MSADNRKNSDPLRRDPKLALQLELLRTGAGSTRERAQLAADAREFLASLPLELAILAEDELISAGYDPEELRHLCSTEMASTASTDAEVRAKLPPGHLLSELYAEHDLILGNVDDLDQANTLIQASDDFDEVALMASQLQVVAENLLASAPHHRREEEILFPVAERHGLIGPTAAMSAEHVGLDYRKMRLHALCARAASMAFADFKKQLNATARMLSLEIRDHIFKENNILYPATFRLIESDELWQQMVKSSEEIGICDFWPRASVSAATKN
ncbi:MAG: hemerythrin domain-containing protein [Chrysiogenetes bacterium]|nr:hemerythrin domain-containing protein [Chrysiogenetes bacterium]